MGGIADHGLIKVADFDFELPLGVGDGAEIANMLIPAEAALNSWMISPPVVG
jgi:hypothetical protein